MTATDPRPALAAALAAAYAEDAIPEPPPPDEAPDAPGEPEAESSYDGSEDEFHYGGETYVGSQDTPEFRAWDERQKRRKEASIARCLEAAGRRET